MKLFKVLPLPILRALLVLSLSIASLLSVVGMQRVLVRPEAFASPLSADLALLARTERVFGHADIEAVVIDGTNRSDPAIREAMKNLTRELKKVPGVKSILSPAHAFRDSSWLPVTVWSSDRMAGRILLQIDESTVPYRESSIAIDTTLKRYPQLNPLRLSAHHLYEYAANEYSARLRKAMLLGSLTLSLGLALIFGFSSTSMNIASLVCFTVMAGCLPPALLGTPIGVLGAAAPLSWLVLHTALILNWTLLTLLGPASDSDKRIQWIIRLSPVTLLLVACCQLWQSAPSAELSTLVQLWTLQLCAAVIPIMLLLLKPGWFSPPKTTPYSALLKLSLPPLARRGLAGIATILVLWPNLAPGLGLASDTVRFDGLLRSLLADAPDGQQLQRIARTIFAADKTISVVINRADGKALNAEDDNLIERVAVRLRQHPGVFAVYSPAAISKFEKLDRSARVLAGGQNPFPWLLHSFYRSQDGNSARLLLETSLDGAALLRLQRELGDIIKSQLNLGVTGLEIEKLRPKPPVISGLPKDLLPPDFGTPPPQPILSAPPPAIQHLGGFIIAREALGESAFLGSTFSASLFVAWLAGCCLITITHRGFASVFNIIGMWSLSVIIATLAQGLVEGGFVIERWHAAVTISMTTASLALLACVIPILLAGLSITALVVPIIAFIFGCLGQSQIGSPFISDFGILSISLLIMSAMLIISCWADALNGLTVIAPKFQKLTLLCLARIKLLLKSRQDDSRTSG